MTRLIIKNRLQRVMDKFAKQYGGCYLYYSGLTANNAAHPKNEEDRVAIQELTKERVEFATRREHFEQAFRVVYQEYLKKGYLPETTQVKYTRIENDLKDLKNDDIPLNYFEEGDDKEIKEVENIKCDNINPIINIENIDENDINILNENNKQADDIIKKEINNYDSEYDYENKLKIATTNLFEPKGTRKASNMTNLNNINLNNIKDNDSYFNNIFMNQ